MMTDPAQQLAGIGWRVLWVAQSLTTFSDPGWLPHTYEDLLLDPIAILSNTCEELLGRPRATRPAAGHGGPPREMEGHSVFDPNAFSSLFSHTAAGTPGTSHGAYGPRMKNPITTLPEASAPGRASLPSLEQARVPFLEEQPEDLDASGPPTHPGGPAPEDPAGSSRRSRQPTKREPGPHGSPHTVVQPSLVDERSATSGSSSESLGGTSRLAHPEQPEDGWTKPLSGAIARAGDGALPDTPEGDAPFSTPPGDSRLAVGAERLAATLRAHLVAPDTEDLSDPVQNSAAAFPIRTEVDDRGPADEPPVDRHLPGPKDAPIGDDRAQTFPQQEPAGDRWPDAPARVGETIGVSEAGAPSADSRLAVGAERLAATLRAHAAAGDAGLLPDAARDDVEAPPSTLGERGATYRQPGRVRPDGGVALEDIMERLADELEAGFARTYGSSGG